MNSVQKVCYFRKELGGSIRALAIILLLGTTLSQAFAGQRSGENSIPEQTKLSEAASVESVSTVVIQSLNSIESDDSVAEIALVELIISDRKRHTGIRVQLRNNTDIDSLYLDLGQVSQFRDELIGLDRWYGKLPCEASQCIQGVARCRPSQTIRQAFCPGFYSTPEGVQGILISTSRYSFNFPSIAPSIVIEALNNAIAELDRLEVE